SWVAAREGGGQALTGARVGRVSSREICDWGAEALALVEGKTAPPQSRGERGPHAVLDPEHARKHHVGTWEISRLSGG
ncbi:MAG: hypothetical protein ACREA0_10580, partial [bacterium]